MERNSHGTLSKQCVLIFLLAQSFPIIHHRMQPHRMNQQTSSSSVSTGKLLPSQTQLRSFSNFQRPLLSGKVHVIIFDLLHVITYLLFSRINIMWSDLDLVDSSKINPINVERAGWKPFSALCYEVIIILKRTIKIVVLRTQQLLHLSIALAASIIPWSL